MNIPENPAPRRLWIFLGAINGFIAVMAGATGAHVLQSRLSGNGVEYFDMAADFQLWHALALIMTGLLGPYMQSRAGIRLLAIAGLGFAAGTTLFCGALYDLAIRGPSGLHWIIPVGGMSLLAGWLSLAASAFFIGRPAKDGKS